MRNLTLCFEAGQLIESSFIEKEGVGEVRSVRGKTGGAFSKAGSFQWTSAVRALSLLVVKTVINSEAAFLKGEGGSLAASLDYALSKQPLWLTDMFGCDRHGISYARRMTLRTNSERKRVGPVIVVINGSYLPVTSIHIVIDGRPATQEDLLTLHSCLTDDGPWPLSNNTVVDYPERLAS